MINLPLSLSVFWFYNCIKNSDNILALIITNHDFQWMLSNLKILDSAIFHMKVQSYKILHPFWVTKHKQYCQNQKLN
jgi:hypothetical protein